MTEPQSKPADATPDGTDRRTALSWLSSFGMAFGLTASYGFFATLAGRYLYPARPPVKGWMFVTEVANLKPGEALVYRSPAGQTVSIARFGENAERESFIALSSVCPHLGCQVHWEPQNDRFFCPCHNGAFDRNGEATQGPPADAGQRLSQYELKIEDDLLFIKVDLESMG